MRRRSADDAAPGRGEELDERQRAPATTRAAAASAALRIVERRAPRGRASCRRAGIATISSGVNPRRRSPSLFDAVRLSPDSPRP